MMCIAEDLIRQLEEHARSTFPEECCGALIGRRDGMSLTVTAVRAFPNAAPPEARRTRFTIDPAALIDLLRELRDHERALIGFYHSHPDHEAVPSETDRSFFDLWPETAWLIVPSTQAGAGPVRAWWVGREDASPSPVELPVSPASGAS